MTEKMNIPLTGTRPIEKIRSQRIEFLMNDTWNVPIPLLSSSVHPFYVIHERDIPEGEGVEFPC